MAAVPFHLLVEGNPVLIYASRNGTPDKVMRILRPFLETFWQERELSEETTDLADYLAAQLVVRYGFEFSEDDYSNLKIGVAFDGRAQYLYRVMGDRTVQIYKPLDAYAHNPDLGLEACELSEVRSVTGEPIP